MTKNNDAGQYSWNFKPLFSGSEDQIQAAIAQEKSDLRAKADEFVSKWKGRSDYLQEPAVLKQALGDYEAWRRYWGSGGKQGFYLALNLALDQNNSRLKAEEAKLLELAVEIENDVQFFTHRISHIPVQEQSKFLNFPELADYKHYLEIIFRESKHLLSEAEEKIINMKHFAAHSKWVDMLEGFLSKEEREIVAPGGKTQLKNFSEIITLASHKDKKVRDSAAAAFNDILQQNVEVAENEINAVFYNKKIDDGLRSFARPDSARHLSDDVDTDMVDGLVQTVTSKFQISRDFYELKAKLLGLPKLEYHERNVEYGDLDIDYPWADSVNLVQETFAGLDQEFVDIFNIFLQEGRLDIFPKKGKSSGAFCSPARSNLPVYVMLNHTDKLNDVRTLAHEMGHAINFEMMRGENELNYDCSLFLAESCSTFMEDFVLQKVIQKVDEEHRLAIMMEKLNSDISTIMRQTAFYNFESELHQKFRKKGYLSHQEIGEIFTKHMISYMGDFVEQSPGSQNWWVYVSHFRRFFYVYSYAGGLLVSKYLQNRVKENHSFIKQVKTYYSTGLSKSPKQTLQDIGIKLNSEFWNRGLAEIEELLAQTRNLAARLGKI